MEENNFKKIVSYIKNTKILLYALIVALVVGSVGTGLSLKRIQGNLYTKEYQINSLVQEIGELREENEYLYQDMLQNRKFTKEGIDLVNATFYKVIDKKELTTNKIIDEYKKSKDDLMMLLNEKNFAINELQNKNSRLVKELDYQNYDDGVKNILLLGINGGLTDTIIIASINQEKQTVALISIPRDLYVNGRKINSIYQKYGIVKFKKDIHTITGVKIDKYAVFNFEGFMKIVDAIGGIDIYVRKSINDYYYPTGNSGYQLYSIEEGSHHLDGESALKYIRSRKSTSDFDRSKRQQQVIQSIRTKVVRLNLISDLDTAIALFDAVISNTKTDVDLFEALSLINHYQTYRIKSDNTVDVTNLLYSTKSYDGQYILLPNSGDFLEIKKYFSDLIKN